MTGLRRHIPELAIEWALDAPDRLWQAVDGTLCFADISGFTALSEKLSRRGRIGGEELVETLSRVFGGMLDAARERDGMLLKFGGDALLFLFKGPDHAVRAASTAVEMRQALRKAREIPTSVGPLNLSMSVGLHSGRIHFFLVGSKHRELVLAGPDASLAAATESAASAGEIGISPSTAALLPASAVRPREDGLLLLRWHKPPAPPAGASPDRQAGEELLRGLFPRALGEVLARGRPEPEHRVACIAFVRFSGTDALLEQQGADAVASALQATLATAMDIFADEDITLLAVDIDRDGGKLFLGSGVPQASEDDEGRMLRALTRLVAAGAPLPLQAGVNRGHVFAAEVGTPRRAAYSAMGDTTNTAARICSKTPPGLVYAHPAVLMHSRSQYQTEQAGPFQFKGKKVPQVVYRVGEPTGTTEGVATEFPVVGRKEELRLLGEAIDALATGVGQVLTLSGAAGLGKSRLLHEALRRLGDIPVMELRAELYGASSPYQVFREPMRALVGIERGDPAVMRAQLLRGTARLDPVLRSLAPLLGDVVHVGVEPTPAVAAIEPRFRQDRIADTVIGLLDAAREGPRVIVVEDAQWTDGASTHLLERLASACATRPWLMLVTRRDEGPGFAPGAGKKIELGPMPAADLAELVNQATAAAPLRPHELDLVVRRASGNPLYAQEIVRAARQVGSFEAVPDSLEAAIAAQVDGLDPEARRVLRYATVLGRRFSRRDLDALLEAEGLAADDAVLARLESFLERDGEDGLRFRIGLLRKTIYEGLAYRLRVQLHRKAGEALERMAIDPAAIADHLAMHFSIAGDLDRTWRYARQAAARAARAYANADAARFYLMALEAARRLPGADVQQRIEAWIDRGTVCRLAGLFDDELSAYREAYRLAEGDPLRRADLLRLRAESRDRAGAFPQALRDLSAAARQLDGILAPEADRLRARLASVTAMIRFAQERPQEAVKQGLAAAEAARKAGDKQALAEALNAAASAQLFMGAGGTEKLLEAVAIYEELGDLSRSALARSNLACGAFLEGQWEEALAGFRRVREARLKAGNVVGAATTASNISEILVKRGELDEALPLLLETVRVLRASGFHEGAAYAEIQLGRLYVTQRDFVRADELTERVARELTDLGQAVSALEAVCVRAHALVGLGRPDDAMSFLDAAANAAGRSARGFAPQIAEARAAALVALGRAPEAREVIAGGLEAARKHSLPYEEALLLRARVELDRRSGRPANVADVESAARIMKGLGVQETPRP